MKVGLAGRVPPGFLPYLPSQSQHNRRLRALTPQLVWVQQRLSGLLTTGTLGLADGTLVGVANDAGCAQRSELAGLAAHGYCPSKSEREWGMRPVLLVDRNGLPAGHTLVPANEKEHEPVRELAPADGSTIPVCDKSLRGRQHTETLRPEAILIRTPDRTRTAENSERGRGLARLRLVVESTITNPKHPMRPEQHLAKTPAGPAQRIAQRLLALTPRILINALTGRPPRALAAYDGR